MKVLHLISGGDTGGAKTHIISLIKGIDNLIQTKIICFIEDTFYQEAKEAGIDIQVFEQRKRSDMSVVARIEDEIIKEDYDIIHCHGARANFIAIFLKRRVNKSFVTTIHSDYELDFKDNFYKKIIFTNLNKFALKRFKHFIAISDNFKDMLVTRGFKEDEIFTAYNGIEMEKERPVLGRDEFLKSYNIPYKGETIVGIVGRLDKVKDHESFIRAASLVLESRKDIIFLLAGDGHEKERLMALVKDLNIGDKVFFLGFVKDPFSFFNAIDINSLSSLSESFPYVILEGALMKKPIISTRVGGLARLVENGENGYLVDVGDYRALAEKIGYLADNKEKAREMGEALYNKVREKHSSEAMARDHLEIYKKILNKDMKNNSVLLSGYFGFDNSGDDAILKAIVKDLRAAKPEINISVLSKNPEKTRETYGVNSINRFKIRQVIGGIKESDLLLSGGGSLLQDITSTRSLLYYLFLMKLGKIYKKPVMVYANGIGPINKRNNRRISKRILNKVDLISLRDDDSKVFIDNLGVNNPDVYVTSDPVFTLEPSPLARVEEIFINENIPRDKKLIGISLRDWKDSERLLDVMVRTIEEIIRTYGANIVLIPMHYPEDLDIGRKLKDRLGYEEVFLLEDQYNVEDIMGLIKELEMIIAMRLHSLIYAASQEVPMVGISYDPKVDGILKSIDMDFTCQVETLNYDELMEKIHMVWTNRLELKEKLSRKNQELKEKALSNISLALDLLNKNKD